MKPCIDCGEISAAARCPEHARALKPSRHARGYGNAWARLSKRARRLSPLCADCGSVEDLTVDHTAQAWERHEAGLEIRLEDVEVVCRSCNGRRGRARPTSDHRGDPASKGSRTPGVAKSATQTAQSERPSRNLLQDLSLVLPAVLGSVDEKQTAQVDHPDERVEQPSESITLTPILNDRFYSVPRKRPSARLAGPCGHDLDSPTNHLGPVLIHGRSLS